MRIRRRPDLFVGALLLLSPSVSAQYGWLDKPRDPSASLEKRISPPQGFTRAPASAGSWAQWLRGLPLKPEGSPVLLFDGRRKSRQDVHHAVLDIDAGTKDLQQCADAVMRLRAEYLWSRKEYAKISFGDGNGKPLTYAPRAGAAHGDFRKFMDRVFARSGSYSLSKELKPARVSDIRAGDVFIKGGFPGHAVIVLDVAKNAAGKTAFLLAQSYMPAQEIHVLNGLDGGSPWYTAKDGEPFETPEWDFAADSLKRFP